MLDNIVVHGNSGDYHIANPQNIPEHKYYYFELLYYGYFQENDWWTVTNLINP